MLRVPVGELRALAGELRRLERCCGYKSSWPGLVSFVMSQQSCLACLLLQRNCVWCNSMSGLAG